MSAMLFVMFGYLAWLGSLWLTYLGGASLAVAIFGVGALGGGILLGAYAYSPGSRRAKRARKRDAKAPRPSQSARAAHARPS